ncbi:MAG: hypothetical protein U0228_25620 [Myxococcaceae bacterium]
MLALALVSTAVLAAPPAPADVPPALKDWVPWVLHHRQVESCPFLTGREEKVCAWPGRLALTLDDKGGRFTQGFRVDGEETWLALPGEPRRWPQHVQVDGKPAVVVAKDSRPVVLIPPASTPSPATSRGTRCPRRCWCPATRASSRSR